ncbi:MAG: phosphatase PAP2 family protein, partial [Oscillospiraceae bacterium]
VMWAIGISFLMSQVVIKGLVGRIRPFEYFNYDTALMLIDIPLDSSFPSSHSCVSFAAATAIILHNRKFGIPAVIIAILVAASRMYLFVHYPSDVLVGTLLGITVAVLAFIIIDRIIKKSEMKKQQKEAVAE